MSCGCHSFVLRGPFRLRLADYSLRSHLEEVCVPTHHVVMTDVLRDIALAERAAQVALDTSGPLVLLLGWRSAMRCLHVAQCDTPAGRQVNFGGVVRTDGEYEVHSVFGTRVIVDPGDPDRVAATYEESGAVLAMLLHHEAPRVEVVSAARRELALLYGLSEPDAPATHDRPVLCPACLQPMTRYEALGLARHACASTEISAGTSRPR